VKSRFFSFLAVSALILGAASTTAASGGGSDGANSPAARNYGVAAPAAVRGSGPGGGVAARATLASFAAAVAASPAKVRNQPTPALMTQAGLESKAQSEKGLNRSGKRALQVTDASAGAPAAADPEPGFPGINMGQTGASIVPDVQIAAGPHHIVEAVNRIITVFNKNGTQAQTATAATFYDGLGAPADDNIFDPQVDYNEYVNRFFVVFTTRDDANSESFLLIAVSNTNDPTQGWSLFALDAGFDGGNNTNNWCDYPQLGYSVEATIIGCNQFSHAANPAFQHVKVRVLLTSQLTGGGCCFWWDFWDLREGFLGSSKVFTVQPAATHSPAIAADGAFLAAAQGGGGNGSNLHVYRVPNPPECCDGDNVGPGLDEAQRGVGSYSAPPAAEQPGGVQAIDTGDTRLQYAVFHWPRMFVGQNLADGSDSTVAFTNFDVDEFPNNMDLRSDWALTAGGMNRYYPGADSRPGSEKSMVYSFSNASTNAGSRWIEIDSAGAVGSEQLQRSGASTFLQLDGIGRNRWGDYLDAARDPNGTGIWVGGEFVNAMNSWGTEITLTRQAADLTPPTTTATHSPTPNANGWNNTNVNITLSSVDGGPAGNVSGVRRITYGAFGANPIPTTTVNSSFAAVPTITANGITTVFYFATDNWGNQESTKFQTVRKDSVLPTFTLPPHQSFQANTTATNTTVPVRTTWSFIDSHSGICSYGPLYRRDSAGGAFVVQPGLPTTPLGTSAIQQLAAGFHQYRIRATDCAGNFAEVSGRGTTLTILQETNASIAYSAGWTTVNDATAMGGKLRQTVPADRTATFSSSTLRNVAWGAKKDSASGLATFKFDALAPVNVNLQSATAQSRRLVAVKNTNPGAHTIVIKNVDTATDPNKITLDFIAWLN
jgi:hypothetical protein